MECTQRLECTQTQDLSDFRTERDCPEQIGFLGICGKKYPVKKGPNKIGRDPQTCNIVLNLNSISRQHAVINVLHNNQFMLMDLDSANKTKLLGKSLQPYIPQPLKNGDMIQFGDVFGIFRLLEEEDDLPMTQALSIPDTPVTFKHVSRINIKTTVPESPDVSDKDDSFIISSQPKGQTFQSPSGHNFLKPGKTISIQPIGTKKIDNIFWNSSKKSVSLNLDESSDSLNNANELKNNDEIDIHEMETQANFIPKANESVHDMDTQVNGMMPKANISEDSINTADTQMPVNNIHIAETQAFVQPGPSRKPPSIHTANTQMPEAGSPSIHSLETQIPIENLPKVCKVVEQHDMQFDIYADDKENDKSIHNAETQFVHLNISKQTEKSKLNTSEDIVLFDEVDNPAFENNFESQIIPTTDIVMPNNDIGDDIIDDDPDIPQSQILKPQLCKRTNRINSDESTDCEDIDNLVTQKIPLTNHKEDDETDCEDEMIELNVDKDISAKVARQLDVDDLPTQIIEDSPSKKNGLDLEDMPTQVISIENNDKEVESKQNLDFEDLPTQVLQEDVPKAQVNNQEFSEELISPFKVPSKIVLKAKKKDVSKTPKIQLNTKPNNEGAYYQDTQDIFFDLCSQGIPSTEESKLPKSPPANKTVPEEVSLKSPEGEKISSRNLILDQSPTIMEAAAKVDEFVSNLSSQDVREVIGVNAEIAKPRKMGSDGSDVENTPKKIRPFKFMDIDLPNSQEIKTSVSLASKTLVTESSSDSESENNSEQCTPILFHKKKKSKPDVKQDLIKKFNAEALPTRVITRVRKPTSKILEGESKKKAETILKPAFLTEQDDNIDREIISENISRLKNKNDKSKGNKDDDSGIDIRINETKDEIADVVKRDRRKRKQSEDKVDNLVKEVKQKRTYNKTSKTSKTDESTSKINEANVPIETSVEPKRSVRSTRGKRSTTEAETEAEQPKPREKRKYTKRQTNPSPEKEVRRSKRQRTVKEEPKPVKSILKNNSTHEQSTVYNISSGSNPESPIALKRPASESVEPIYRRTRCSKTSLRATPARVMKTQHVLFTAFPYEEVKVRLEKLGAVIVTDVMQSTVLLTLQIKRTFKLLCAVGLGKPIVGPNWVQACADTSIVVDPWLYLIKDEAAEKRFNFSLEKTLRGTRNFLSGWNISSTPSVLPNATEMKLIVECSGGIWQEGGKQWICVSCTADKTLWPMLRKRGATLVSTEFILGGVLRQQLEIQANLLKG